MRRFLRLAALILSFSSLVRTRRRGGTGRERLGGFTLVGFPFGPAFFALEGFAFLVESPKGVFSVSTPQTF